MSIDSDVVDGLKSIGKVQLPFKLATFLLTILTVQFTSSISFGIAHISFHILTGITLLLPREIYRPIALRNHTPENALITTVNGTLLALLLLPLIFLVWTLIQAPADPLHPLKTTLSILIISTANLIEILTEPYTVSLLINKKHSSKALAEGINNCTRTVATFLALIISRDSNSPIPFSIGALTAAIASGWFTVQMTDLRFRNVISSLYRRSIKSFTLPPLTLEHKELRRSLAITAIQVFAMEESDKLLLILLFPMSDATMGSYALVANLVSVVVRVVFAPLEALAFNAFSLGNKDPDKLRLNTLHSLVGIQGFIGACCAVFGVPMTGAMVLVLYGVKWGSDIGVLALFKLYFVYVFVLSIFGILNAYVKARADAKWLEKYSLTFNLASWGAFYGSALLFRMDFFFGLNDARALIAAQIVTCVLRTMGSLYYLYVREGGSWAVKTALFGSDMDGLKLLGHVFGHGLVLWLLGAVVGGGDYFLGGGYVVSEDGWRNWWHLPFLRRRVIFDVGMGCCVVGSLLFLNKSRLLGLVKRLQRVKEKED